MSSPSTSSSLSTGKLLALLALAIGGTALVVYLVMRSASGGKENVVQVLDQRAAEQVKVNTSVPQTVVGRSGERPALGQRYNVRIESESREGTDGIAKIGGMITFVQGARPGQEVVVEITRLNQNTAQAIIVGDAEPGSVAAAPAGGYEPRRAPAAGPVYTGVVASVGKYGDGVIYGRSGRVYVKGTEMGDRVAYAVTEQRDGFANGRVVEKLGKADAAELAAASSPREERPKRADSASDAAPKEIKAPQIQVGQEHEVTIAEPARQDPTGSGAGRVDGLVVIVTGAKVGDKVLARITNRAPRYAEAELVRKLDAAPAATAP